jgi:hypothetical protein
VVQGVDGPLWGGVRVLERGREEGVFLVEGDCDNLWLCTRSSWRVVRGVCIHFFGLTLGLGVYLIWRGINQVW